MKISKNLNTKDYEAIQEMLSTLPSNDVSLDQVWQLMDQVWDEIGCDSDNLDKEKITTFYKHPIWLLNGFFIEQHELSLQHRYAISDWIVQNCNHGMILDFGGGFGTLARMVADKSSLFQIDIYEPYPSNFAILQCAGYSSISFVSDLSKKYNCIISTDVLEHVSDPLLLFWQMIESVHLDGYLIIANCFYPVIKCHLPCTFHFRYSFDEFATVMGLKVIGLCEGSHAKIYRKTENKIIDWKLIRKMERRSRNLYKWREFKAKNVVPWENKLKRLMADPIKLFKSILVRNENSSS